MPTKYPAAIDNSLTLPPVVDNSTPVSAKEVNNLRQAIIAVQSELGTNPAGNSSTIKNRINELENSINTSGVSISGDLGGTSSNVKVIGLQGRLISNTAPNASQVLSWNGSQWAPSDPSGGGGDPFNGTPSSLGVAAAGSSELFARGDHVHAHGNLAGGTLHSLADGSNAGFMSSANFTKLSGISAGSNNPSTITTSTSTVGVATAYSREDHAHPHGNLSGGSLHSLASGATNGFMSSADFTKLASVPTPANILTTSSVFSGDVEQTSSTTAITKISGASGGSLNVGNTLERIYFSSSATAPRVDEVRTTTSITASSNSQILLMDFISGKSQRFDASIIITSSSDKTKIATLDITRLITFSGGTYTARNHAAIADAADDANAIGITYTIDVIANYMRIRVLSATANLSGSVFATLRTGHV